MQDVLTSALEAGVGTVVFDESQGTLAQEWQQLGRFEAITRTADGRLLDAGGAQVLLPAAAGACTYISMQQLPAAMSSSAAASMCRAHTA